MEQAQKDLFWIATEFSVELHFWRKMRMKTGTPGMLFKNKYFI